MDDIKLSDARRVFEDVNLEEILFVSDIEHFTNECKDRLLKEIKNKKIKLVVFLGDILSFLTKYSSYVALLDKSDVLVNLFYKKIKDDIFSSKSKLIIGLKISDYLKKAINREKDEKFYLKNFKDFIKNCKKQAVNIIYYSGNHDFVLDGGKMGDNLKFIPFLKEIINHENLYVPYKDLELITLNRELFLMGVHTHSDESTCNQYLNLINPLNQVEKPEKIIFVSHIPGKTKYIHLGSEEITLFKRKFKFKYHYHGHCRNYYGEYLEEGIPTKSVHINDNPLKSDSDKGKLLKK